jgi:hypothetical protein
VVGAVWIAGNRPALRCRVEIHAEPRALQLERELRHLAATRPDLALLMARFADSAATNAPSR